MEMVSEEELGRVTYEIFTKLEKKWLSGWLNKEEKNTEERKIRILSIDGGGLKGLISGQALVYFEKKLKEKSGDPDARIADFFDVIAGTGIGGVFASMLLADDGNGRPLFAAEDAVKIIAEKISNIFRPSGFFRRRWPSRRFDGLLRNLLSRAGRPMTLRDSLKPLLIPCYDLNSAAPFVFSRADAVESKGFDFELWRVCRATCATPNRFKPVHLSSMDGRTGVTAIDGGLVMNNPSAAVVTHVLHNKRDFPKVNGVEDLVLLSLGNGGFRTPGKLTGCRKSFSGEWGKGVVEIVLDGVSDTVDQILGNAFFRNPQDYVRIQGNGFSASKEVDASVNGVIALVSAGEGMLREKAVETLPLGGKRLLTETNGQRLDSFAKRLVESTKAVPLSPSKANADKPAG
ncbi:probable inactive patatin-like protein 9 isoform X1 [Amborella trichopoda]|uniref:Patatin n=1 Tax=Amborella trichopoda TaxID=13333 RepID=W1PXQ6_AMBTC|nr:probable inactive patatin-like protein 9 isoform X1 [Amborella trichopoda]ERN12661.1 hypothetical protein AMTR_s00025p00242850 [Amborella trichopoda]|eukprot:XP_006851080.1 probable inactive patatin-like protein 9 isoform X1 [Amborella trichopoda]